jgi:hypothetical protein
MSSQDVTNGRPDSLESAQMEALGTETRTWSQHDLAVGAQVPRIAVPLAAQVARVDRQDDVYGRLQRLSKAMVKVLRYELSEPGGWAEQTDVHRAIRRGQPSWEDFKAVVEEDQRREPSRRYFELRTVTDEGNGWTHHLIRATERSHHGGRRRR